MIKGGGQSGHKRKNYWPQVSVLLHRSRAKTISLAQITVTVSKYLKTNIARPVTVA